MKTLEKHTVYTIGHSNHSIEAFIGILQSFDIKVLCDVRSLPGSRKFPHFNKENLKISLENNGINYIHMEGLGGRRKMRKDSKNNRWRNESFRGYADYMETDDFKNAVSDLKSVALKHTTAYMCSEAVWWSCHRSMISDYLKAKGWTVLHIMAAGKVQEHPYTSPAIVTEGHISYSDATLF
ncbi:iron-sulfur cluster assembly protein HesB [Sporocytophaga myxococcoides]|uniref:Iron-sulfur cluster assembly protein HesB n=1 Tax=Sporocytophaga myxococcoides TaxID=153721 RepID=A0A098LG95_9BACT|nr:DUF488 domain-containing protein [Sporocytophaga myxococcoides]GAL86001.1 iron-sulfur cluster assembly protein HesB [Sporocytophaga myxococcoides]